MPLITSYQNNTYKILAIDPGINTTGVACYEIEYNTNKILAIEALTLINDKLADRLDMDEYSQSLRTIKLYKLKAAIANILVNEQPILVVCESPFYNPCMPNAFGSLVETISIIQSAVLEYNTNIIFTTVAPLLVKSTVRAGMTTGKLDVKAAISRIEVITNVLRNNLEYLDEHSIDAIAIGYTFLKLQWSI